MLPHLLNKDPIQRCTLQDLAHNNWITKDGREPLKLTTKDEGEDLNATGFEISNALSFARIVRLKTKMRLGKDLITVCWCTHLLQHNNVNQLLLYNQHFHTHMILYSLLNHR